MDKKKLINIGLFILFAAVTIGLRLLYLRTDLWYDEACSWFTAIQSFPFGIMDNLKNLDVQHTPLYFFLLHFWIKMFGDFEVNMRILSLIFGIATIPMVYTVANKITSKPQALFATALAAVNPVLVLFSVEVRMYPIVVFLVLLSLNYLIDFERENNSKSLIKLVIVNLLIPYTLVGGILYNIALFACYGLYLHNNKKKVLKKYLIASGIEFILLIPYFILISYYAKMRSIFVVAHEGNLELFHVIDIIRNFFGAQIANNIYWPTIEPYNLTFVFCILVIVPCVYFLYGFIQGRKSIDDKFLETLYNVFIVSFCLSVVFSIFRVNVFTVRYILHLLPPVLILSVIGLFNKLTVKHCKIVLSLVILAFASYSIYNAAPFGKTKTLAFKTVRLEADKLHLGVDDMIIMPFGADAPYYFRNLTAPRVFNFDFHKGVRNPYSDIYYDKLQQNKMAGRLKYLVIYSAVNANGVFSDNFLKYFITNVNQTVPSGRYVLIAFYGSDVNSITSIEQLRSTIKNEYAVEGRVLEIMLKKYLCDMSIMLNLDFDFVKSFKQDNYTFFLYRKR